MQSRDLRLVTLLSAGVLACGGPASNISIAAIPADYQISGISLSGGPSDGATIQSQFTLRSDDPRSPVVHKVLAEVSLAGDPLGDFSLVDSFRLTARSGSSALLRGRVAFTRITAELYRSLFRPEIAYHLQGRSTFSFKGLRRTRSIQGEGRLTSPVVFRLTFADDTATRLVKLDSARFDGPPSDRHPVGVSLNLVLTNPFQFPVTLSSASYRMMIGDQPFLSGQSDRSMVLKPGPSPLHFKTVVRPVRGVEAVADRFVSGKALGVSVSGQVTLEESGRKIVVQITGT